MCKFDNEFFSFLKDIGVPIGSPLGVVIGEALMSKLEENLFHSSHDYLQHIVYWHEYVDNVFYTNDHVMVLAML